LYSVIGFSAVCVAVFMVFVLLGVGQRLTS